MFKYSVIIPCFNCGETIQETLLSCINQEYPCYEIILIDDFSSQDIHTLVTECMYLAKEKKIDFKYQRNSKNYGVSRSRNIGWNLSTGDYICFLDADDIWHQSKLNIINNFILKKTACFICHDYTNNEFQKETITNIQLEKIDLYKALIKNPSQTSCFILSSNIKERFNESMRHSEDYDLWLRILRKNSLFFLKGTPLTRLSRLEQTPGGLSGNRFKMRLGEIKAYYHFSKGKLFIFMPILIMYSLLKHIYSEIRYATNANKK